MKIIIGCAPNLPWHKIKNMTDEEIQNYNIGFYKEIEMKDDSLSDTQPNSTETIHAKAATIRKLRK